MPGPSWVARSRKSRQKKTIKRYFKRKYGRTTGTTADNSFGRTLKTLQPTKMKVNLRFAFNSGDVHAIASTAGSVVDWVYRANAMYDPYAGAGGNQARGWDQYMALYRSACVIGSKAYCRFMYKDNNAASNYFMKCAVLLRDGATAITSHAQISESPRGQSCVLTTGQPPQRISKSFSTRKFFNKRNPLDDDTLSGTATADPAQQAYYHVCAYALNGESATCYVDGWIDYIVVLHEPIIPAQS